jgi:dolichol-phosphate mannosyltransferase
MLSFIKKTIDFLHLKTGLPLRHIVKFGIVGFSGVLVNMGLFYILNEYVHLRYEISSLIAIEASILSNFFLNSLWTWKERKTLIAKEKYLRFFKYHAVTGFSASINYLTLLTLTKFFSFNPYLSNLGGIFLAMGLNFSLNHLWTFKKDKKKGF